MIAFIKGELCDIEEDKIIVECNGMGYNIYVPQSVISCLPATGMEVKIYTYLAVREDAMQLFGFFNKDDLKVFKLLITVNGIGPKGALNVLSVLTPDELRFAVISGDYKSISKAPGVGTKTAQKVILELADKLNLEDTLMPKSNNNSAFAKDMSPQSEAVAALTSLGYSQSEAARAVKLADTDSEDVEEILKAALKKITF